MEIRNRLTWEGKLALYLILTSIVLYAIHLIIYRDINHILLWGLTNIAFLPISVLFVTLFINKLLIDRERTIRLEKLNMVIGAFYSDLGTDLLALISDWDKELDRIQENLLIEGDWTKEEFEKVKNKLRKHPYEIDMEKADIPRLRTFLKSKRDFMLRLLENPNILEHESFTALLRSVFHLSEELYRREKIKNIPDTDKMHMAGDIKRVYIQLVREWLDYMSYLKEHYPYLFSLAIRTNPFDETATPIISQ